ncbi:outer membrane beta-barrel protein [Pseudomonadota bacterium]
MKKCIKWIVVSFMLFGFSGAVFAQGAYIGVGGYIADPQDAPWDSADTEWDFTGSIGYMFSPNFGIEYDHYRLGKFETNAATLKTTANALALMLVAPLKSAKLYAKIGAANIKTKVDSSAGLTILDSDSTEAFGGIGVEFGPKNVGFYLEAMYFPNDVSDILTYGAGVRFWFGK